MSDHPWQVVRSPSGTIWPCRGGAQLEPHDQVMRAGMTKDEAHGFARELLAKLGAQS